MRTYLSFSLILVFSLSQKSCYTPELKKGMVQFDRAFIPVWVHVKTENSFEAKNSVFYLEFEWQKFENRFALYFPENEDWSETFRRTEDWLRTAYTAIDGNNFDLARSQLDHVRYELSDLRRRHNLEYYPDYLFDFEDVLDEVLETINDEMLCLLEWNEFEKLVEKMNQKWELIELKTPTPEFGFTDFELNKLGMVQKSLSLSLIDFTDAVSTGDRQEAVEAAQFLHPEYLKMLTFFGDFDQEAAAAASFYTPLQLVLNEAR